MTPGTYLRKRREAAGISLEAAALTLAVECADRPRIRVVDEVEVRALHDRLAAAEDDADNLTLLQFMVLRRIVRMDSAVYEALLLRYHGCSAAPLPQVCRECACSWNDPCRTQAAPAEPVEVCAWSDHDPELCTACERRHAGEWPDAPLPEGAAHA